MYGQVGLAAQTSQNQSKFDGNSQFVIQPVRVRFTFLDIEKIKKEYPALLKKYNEYDALSGILFEPFTNPVLYNSDSVEDNLINNYNFAKPLFPNMRQVPLLNEIAYIVSFPSTNSQDPRNIDLNQPEFYYFLPINLWNTAHQNGFPDPVNQYNAEESPKNKTTLYTNAEAGATQNTTEEDSQEINLGETFEDKGTIKNLQPFEGDIIYEGRWGQSIRFGSTVLNKNPWSTQGTNGDPIFILNNGQASSTSAPWIPTVENINEDLGSIYATSTQQIPIQAYARTFNSYPSDPPISPNQYTGNQIIINSGRLLFNATNDHIILSSGKSINLNAYQSINIDTDQTILSSNNIYLGSKDAVEPLLLGEQTVALLDELISNMKSFMTICETLIGVPAGAPVVPLNSIASTINSNLTLIQRDLDGIKSKNNFTI